MIKNFKELVEKAKEGKKPKIAVAVAQDEKVLAAVVMANEIGLATSVLVGDKEEIEAKAKSANLDISPFEIVDKKDKGEACLEAIRLIRDGKADLPMKGIVETSMILRAVLNKEMGLRTDKLLSHVGVLEVDGFEKLIIISDAAMNIAPDLAAKVHIIENTNEVALALDIEEPKVAIVCATETVNDKMIATLDAAELTRMNEEEGKFKPAVVKGPLGLDNSVSLKAAKTKGIDHPVAGNADVLIAPDIEAGNILNKSMEYFAKAQKSGVIMGAKVPIILTSRASSETSKMNSIALALLILKNKKEG